MEDDDWTDDDDEHEYRPYSLDDDPDPWEEYFRVYGLDRPLGSEGFWKGDYGGGGVRVGRPVGAR